MAPVDWSSRWSTELRSMRPSSIVAFANSFAHLPDVVKLHVGLPSADSFPLATISATTAQRRGTSFMPQLAAAAVATAGAAAAHVGVTGKVDDLPSGGAVAAAPTPDGGFETDSEMSETGADDGFTIRSEATVTTAQQYIFSRGYAPLLQWASDVVAAAHSPLLPTEVCMTAGSTQAVSAVMQCLTDHGDFLVCEEFTFAPFIDTIFAPRRLQLLPVKMDSQGMVPAALDAALSRAASAAVASGTAPPRVLFTIPNGQNPTGAVMGIERKREIYTLAQKWDLVIVEDDAYWWLQYGDEVLRNRGASGSAATAGAMPGLQLPPSFLSLDVDGRVVRIDTFSKLLGPGYRIGWVTGPPPVAEKVAQVVQGNSAGPCSLSMVMVSEMLQSWGPRRFEEFLRDTQAVYRGRAAAADAAATRHLSGLATWAAPRAGMFMWIRLDCLPDVNQALVDALMEARVVVMPGRLFWAYGGAQSGEKPCPFLRATFGGLHEDAIEEGIRRLGEAIRKVVAIQASRINGL